MEEGANKVGLRINEQKTKYMINTRNKVHFRNEKHLQVYNYKSERVAEFKYLGSLITENSDNNTDIKARICRLESVSSQSCDIYKDVHIFLYL